MAGLTQTEQGTSETASLARTAIGATYRVACRITTSGGNIDERTKKIMVRNR